MGFHPNEQLRLLEQGLDVTRVLRQAMGKRVPWHSIIEFATSEQYCNQSLYPRQQTLLRLIYLETERMTQYDRDVIDEWREGFTNDLAVCGVQPDIWERVEYLKHRGYRRFPHIQLVLGRRGSKGLIGAILAVEMIARLIALDNPQKVYNIREGKDVFLNVGATSQTQAQRHQFADIRDIVEACAWLQPYIAETKDHQLRLRTPADVRRIAQRKAEGIPIEHLMASIWVVALSASSVAARGATAFANYFDEFAFHVQGSGSIKSGEEIYEDWSPSLGQFKQEALTYVPSSPFTKVGKFFELYQQGRVLMGSYQSSQLAIEARQEIRNMQATADLDEVELKADPTMLILQGPSWMLYEDWERGAELTGFQAPFPPEDDLSSEVQQRRQIHNPEKFAVERLGQFAEVMGAYLDKHKVAAMFKPVRWREPEILEPTAFGRLDHTYRIHVDPSVTGANFALCIGHTELAPCDRCGAVTLDPEPHECMLATCWKDEAGNRGMHWPHVIIDRLKVWRAIDFERNPETNKHEIDYTIVERELDEILYHFPSTTKFSADQWNSVGFLQRLRNKYAPSIRVVEETATAQTNWSRAEKFKSALNLGWIHSYKDHFYGDGESLLEMECNFLSEKGGKVYKQEFGPVQTKDLYDAVSVVVTDLLHTALERWERSRLTARTIGSSNVPGLRSGREFDRLAAMIGSSSTYRLGHRGSGRRSWEELENYQLARRRGQQRDPYYATRSRLRDITERNKN